MAVTAISFVPTTHIQVFFPPVSELFLLLFFGEGERNVVFFLKKKVFIPVLYVSLLELSFVIIPGWQDGLCNRLLYCRAESYVLTSRQLRWSSLRGQKCFWGTCMSQIDHTYTRDPFSTRCQELWLSSVCFAWPKLTTSIQETHFQLTARNSAFPLFAFSGQSASIPSARQSVACNISSDSDLYSWCNELCFVHI